MDFFTVGIDSTAAGRVPRETLAAALRGTAVRDDPPSIRIARRRDSLLGIALRTGVPVGPVIPGEGHRWVRTGPSIEADRLAEAAHLTGTGHRRAHPISEALRSTVDSAQETLMGVAVHSARIGQQIEGAVGWEACRDTGVEIRGEMRRSSAGATGTTGDLISAARASAAAEDSAMRRSRDLEIADSEVRAVMVTRMGDLVTAAGVMGDIGTTDTGSAAGAAIRGSATCGSWAICSGWR